MTLPVDSFAVRLPGVRVLPGETDNGGTRWRGCLAKRPFDSLGEAERTARMMHKKFKGAFVAYGCAFCGRFHVARDKSRSAAIRRSRRRRAVAQ